MDFIKSSLKKINYVTILIALLTGVIGWQLGQYKIEWQWNNFRQSFKVQNQEPPKNANIDFKLFWETWDLVSKEYVDKKAIDPQKMYYGAIQGMVAALGDPYTVFLPPEQQKATQEDLGGSFEGVGIQLGYNKDKRLVVIAPLSGTPAEKAGIKAGDLIVKIGDKETGNITLPEAVNLIRGEKGSTIDLEIYRDGEVKTQTFTLKRDTIVVKSVELQEKSTPQNKKVAYIKLSKFGEKTNQEWNEAVSTALAKGVDGVILDVRNNPGGFLDSAVYIGSEFIASGDIVMHEDAQGQRQGYKVSRAGKLLNLPLVVLINKGSASASEIVSGAIQDYNRGKLVGEQSFGKGTIQDSRELPGGTGIHVTTAKWLTPKGRWIHTTGLTPDVKVELKLPEPSQEPAQSPAPTPPDNQLEEALKVLDQQINK